MFLVVCGKNHAGFHVCFYRLGKLFQYAPIIDGHLLKVSVALQMESAQNIESKKRTLGYMMTAEISGKLRSKADYYQYLDKHSKSLSNLLTDLLTV